MQRVVSNLNLKLHLVGWVSGSDDDCHSDLQLLYSFNSNNYLHMAPRTISTIQLWTQKTVLHPRLWVWYCHCLISCISSINQFEAKIGGKIKSTKSSFPLSSTNHLVRATWAEGPDPCPRLCPVSRILIGPVQARVYTFESHNMDLGCKSPHQLWHVGNQCTAPKCKVLGVFN